MRSKVSVSALVTALIVMLASPGMAQETSARPKLPPHLPEPSTTTQRPAAEALAKLTREVEPGGVTSSEFQRLTQATVESWAEPFGNLAITSKSVARAMASSGSDLWIWSPQRDLDGDGLHDVFSFERDFSEPEWKVKLELRRGVDGASLWSASLNTYGGYMVSLTNVAGDARPEVLTYTVGPWTETRTNVILDSHYRREYEQLLVVRNGSDGSRIWDARMLAYYESNQRYLLVSSEYETSWTRLTTLGFGPDATGDRRDDILLGIEHRERRETYTFLLGGSEVETSSETSFEIREGHTGAPSPGPSIEDSTYGQLMNDVSGDGLGDLLVQRGFFARPQRISIYPTDGSGVLWQRDQPHSDYSWAYPVELFGDQATEIFAYSLGDDGLYRTTALRGANGSEVWTSPGYAFLIGDTDGDSVRDGASIQWAPGSTALTLSGLSGATGENSWSRSFSAPEPAEGNDSLVTCYCLTGDLGGDGITDGIVYSFEFEGPPDYRIVGGQATAVDYRDGTDLWSTGVVTDPYQIPGVVYGSDFNSNGTTDLVIGERAEDPSGDGYTMSVQFLEGSDRTPLWAVAPFGPRSDIWMYASAANLSPTPGTEAIGFYYWVSEDGSELERTTRAYTSESLLWEL